MKLWKRTSIAILPVFDCRRSLSNIFLAMFKQLYCLAVLCMLALHSHSSSARSLDHHTEPSVNDFTGYWLSYSLSSACFMCNCTLIANFIYNNQYQRGLIMLNINESTCDGVPISPVHDCKNSCIGRPGFLIGQLIDVDRTQFWINGTMGESTCAGLNYDIRGVFVVNCQGQQRSESIVLVRSK